MKRAFSQRNRIVLGVAIVAVVALVCYWPALRGDFILDDNKLITENPIVHASNGLLRFWGTTEPADYWPLTNSSFWLEWRMWGKNPAGYHVTNLLLHVAAALLLWAILQKLAIPGAFLAALLFAVHPVNVESVAWISQLKNTLGMVFFLLSILWYLLTIKQRTTDNGPRTAWWYGLSLLAFLLAMFSKGSLAILPVLLLVIAWWQRGRIDKSDLLRTAPFFVATVALTAVNLWFQKHGMDIVVRNANFGQRFVGAGAAVWFYLAKALVPIDLIFVYPNWQIETSSLLWWLPVAAALVVTLLLARQPISPASHWRRALLFAWLTFCTALVPVLGFADVGFMQYSLVADHYEHIALIVVVALVAAGWRTWHDHTTALRRVTANLVLLAVVGLLGVTTWQQCRLFRNAITLYEATLLENPLAWVIQNNLGQKLYSQGDLAGAQRITKKPCASIRNIRTLSTTWESCWPIKAIHERPSNTICTRCGCARITSTRETA